MHGAANPLDEVIEKHKLPVVRCVDYKENNTGSCWYDSVAFSVNKYLAEEVTSFRKLLENMFYIAISSFCQYVDLQRDETIWADCTMTSVRIMI